MRETEITAQIFDDYQTTKQKLLAQGYNEIHSFEMIDSYFTSLSNTNIEYQELINNSFLLRKFSDDSTHYMIYKNKEFDKDGNVVSEEKITTKIESVESVKNILNKANFNNYANISTKNYVFKKEHIEFVLQDVESLGLFIEIEEFKTMKNLSTDEKLEKLITFLKELNLNIGNNYNCKKIELIIKQKAEK